MNKKINLSRPFLNIQEKKYLNQVISRGWLTNGPMTIKFEERVKKIIGSKFAIAVNSCTNGIIATLKALGLKEGDEIITTPMTFVSVIHALELFKFKIKLVDINTENYSLDFNSLKKNIGKKTKCVLITHYGGIPVDTREIINFCKKKKIFVVEDAATAFGSKIGNKMVGSSKNSISIFSFYANKVITTGEGGIITLNNRLLASKIRTIISCGINKDPWKRSFQKKIWHYDVDSFGYKFNFTDIQAAIGIAQLKKLKKIIIERRKIRKKYNNLLNPLIKENIIKVFKPKANTTFSEYIYAILLNKKKINSNRDGLINFLRENNVFTTVHYIPANYHNFYKKKFKKFKLPNSNYTFNNILSLPFHNHLKNSEIIKVSQLILNYFKKNEKK
tara:strand:- start:1465 stop:2631 length:1167 start_codon:yes stop_codon:yes gene_type:complete